MADAVAVSALSQLEVLEPVVGPIAIDVMNGLIGSQRTPDRFRHHETML